MKLTAKSSRLYLNPFKFNMYVIRELKEAILPLVVLVFLPSFFLFILLFLHNSNGAKYFHVVIELFCGQTFKVVPTKKKITLQLKGHQDYVTIDNNAIVFVFIVHM